MKKFSVNCDFGGQSSPFAVYIGVPEGSHHPLHFQADWLSKNRGGTIPQEFMDAISKLKTIAEKNNVSLEELCVYALGAAQQEQEDGSNAGTHDEAKPENTNALGSIFDVSPEEIERLSKPKDTEFKNPDFSEFEDDEFDQFEDNVQSVGSSLSKVEVQKFETINQNTPEISDEYLDNLISKASSDSNEKDDDDYDEYSESEINEFLNTISTKKG
jgi:hypothetical protein